MFLKLKIASIEMKDGKIWISCGKQSIYMQQLLLRDVKSQGGV